jgi:CHASE1-domain containing sensor protein
MVNEEMKNIDNNGCRLMFVIDCTQWFPFVRAVDAEGDILQARQLLVQSFAEPFGVGQVHRAIRYVQCVYLM